MEEFDIYDEAGHHVGRAPRSRCHGDPSLIHRTAHVVVFAPGRNALLLQRRSRTKDIQPGKWDTAVGGHLQPGETPLEGAKRELAEELGIRDVPLTFLFESRIRNEIESENVSVFGLTCSGPFSFQKEEIDEVRFWSYEELKDPGNFAEFTPNLCSELETIWSRKIAAPPVPAPQLTGWNGPAVVLRFVIGFVLGLLIAGAGALIGWLMGGNAASLQSWHWCGRILPFFAGAAAVLVFAKPWSKGGRGESE